jgi:hypothetical protein
MGLSLAAMGFYVGISGLQTAQAAVLAQFDYFTAAGGAVGQPFYTNYYMAQTFTTTQAGDVASVDLPIDSTRPTILMDCR